MILEARNITKRFGQIIALSNLTFDMQKGETIAILGESGSGKTTLLRIICGLEDIDSGELSINHKVLNNNNTFLRPENRNIGLVFQDNALFPHLNVFNNIAFGVSRKMNRFEKVSSLMAITKLTGLEKRMPHELSGGQQQRVALARALATEPELLLLDEPFSTLDHSLKNEIRSEIKDIIKTSGVSCIIVTHHIDDATSMADRIAILKDGKLIQINTSKIIFDNPASEYVAKLFGTVNQLDGVFFRAKDLILGEGNRVAAVRESYFENGLFQTTLEYNNQVMRCVHSTFLPIETKIHFSIKKNLSFSVK
ncbi:MAG: ABC transporter ATP-binding protein [Flavobacteriales bacterium]|nr:ABC transporter ATP-binding protein [Flavobacteriales bacterium]